jgi:LmeA-like phospholipid-binding
MFGGFIGFGNTNGQDWGENLLNTVATNTIRHLFTSCDSIKVEVRCHPSSKLLQGSIDSFKMVGKGLVIRREFRTEEMSFETDAVSLDFSSVMKGKLELKQSTQAIALVKLTETDLNNSFQAELVRKRLENLNLPALKDISGGEPVSFTKVKLELWAHNQIKLYAIAKLPQGDIPIALSCTLGVIKRRRIAFNEIEFLSEGIPETLQNVSETLTNILGEILNEMVDLDRFNLDGITMRINRLETAGKTLVFSGYAQIDNFPNT